MYDFKLFVVLVALIGLVVIIFSFVRLFRIIIESLFTKLIAQIEHQSKFEILLKNINESIIIISQNNYNIDDSTSIKMENKIDYVNDMFITQF